MASVQTQETARPSALLTEARHYLILLGFVCQGFACERWYMPFVFLAFWVGGLHARRARRLLPEELEALMLLGVLVAGYRLAPALGMVWFAGMSNSLVIYQVHRLMWPQDVRQKTYTAAVAVTQIAVGAQVLFDYRFGLVLIAALVLIPSTLFELEAQRLGRRAGPMLMLTDRRVAALVVVLLLAVFLGLPRWQITRVASDFGVRSSSQQMQHLDSTGGGREAGEQLLLRVEGDSVGYLRCLALDTFENHTWTAHAAMFVERRRLVSGDRRGTLYRRVEVVAPKALKHVLPVDGHAVHVDAGMIQRPYMSESGAVMTQIPVRRAFTYSYWTRPGALPLALAPRWRRWYTRPPEVSQAVSRWLDARIGRIRDPFTQAQALVEILRTELTYEIGAPTLDSPTPLAEFLLVQKRGHCERFASALAVLLRLKGIPSRVVVGYVPAERNVLGGFYNVRARHGHAWTEGWFGDKGWVALDATPVGEGFAEERRKLSLTLLEWIEYVWYAKVVQFGTSEQFNLAERARGLLRDLLRLVRRQWTRLFEAGVVLLLAVLFAGSLRRRAPCADRKIRRVRALKEANHFYGRMLKALARQKLVRAFDQTPHEFLRTVEARGHAAIEDVRQVTESFCAVRYAEADLPPHDRESVLAAVRRISRSRRGRR